MSDHLSNIQGGNPHKSLQPPAEQAPPIATVMLHDPHLKATLEDPDVTSRLEGLRPILSHNSRQVDCIGFSASNTGNSSSHHDGQVGPRLGSNVWV